MLHLAIEDLFSSEECLGIISAEIFVCVYVYLYVCMHVGIYMSYILHVISYKHTYIHNFCMYLCVRIFFVCLYLCVCICMYVRLYVYACICIECMLCMNAYADVYLLIWCFFRITLKPKCYLDRNCAAKMESQASQLIHRGPIDTASLKQIKPHSKVRYLRRPRVAQDLDLPPSIASLLTHVP